MWILIIEDLAGTLVTSFFWTKAKGDALWKERAATTPTTLTLFSLHLMNNGGQKWNDRTINCCPGKDDDDENDEEEEPTTTPDAFPSPAAYI